MTVESVGFPNEGYNIFTRILFDTASLSKPNNVLTTKNIYLNESNKNNNVMKFYSRLCVESDRLELPINCGVNRAIILFIWKNILPSK